MKMYLIKLSKKDNARGFYELALNGPVRCFPDNTYEVSEEQLKILDKLGISYKKLWQAKEIKV